MIKPSFSPGERRILRYVIFFVILTRLLLMFRSEERIYTRPFNEDSFYLFNCAEHFAHGEGFTCDGKQPTNGVQPLIVILYAPLFLIAGTSKILALRLAFIFVALFDSLSVIFLAWLVRTIRKKPTDENVPWKSPPVIAAILWATLYSIFVHTGNGLETGVYSVLLLYSLYCYARLWRMRSEGIAAGRRHWIWLGIILGFTVLARIDAIFLVAFIALFEWYKCKGQGFIHGAVLSLFAFLVSSPWWIYNYRLFGSIMPQSGISEALKHGVLAENIRRSAIVIGDILAVFFFLPNYDLPAWFHYAWLIGITGIVAFVVRKLKLHEYLRRSYATSSFIPYYFFCGSLAIYYVFFFSAPHFLPRYFHPLRIIWLVLFACAAPEILRSLSLFSQKKKKLAFMGILVFVIGAAAFSGSLYVYYFSINKVSDFYLAGKFALQHPTELMGMQQSGTAGFVASNVVNLDGKVNNAALQAQLQGDIGAYIESEKLDYLADWPEFTDSLLSSSARHGGRFHELDSIGRVKVFRREK
jgi:hypothetical protein